MQMNENIATSAVGNDYSSELLYNYDMTGTKKYIAFSTVEASNTGNQQFDKYMDLLSALNNGIYFVCGTSQGGISPH
jgi:hypothetical protein